MLHPEFDRLIMLGCGFVCVPILRSSRIVCISEHVFHQSNSSKIQTPQDGPDTTAFEEHVRILANIRYIKCCLYKEGLCCLNHL